MPHRTALPGWRLPRNRDLDRAIDTARRMLDVHPRAEFVGRIEVKAGEFRPRSTVRRPPADAFALVQQIAVAVQILREPDVVVLSAVATDSIGVFGMTAYAVTRRRPEIGVRMAFGASPAQWFARCCVIQPCRS